MAWKCYGSKTRAPRDYHARWDDNGRLLSDLPNVPFLVGPCKLDNGLSNFLLHVRCCTILEEFFYPKPVPVARLIEICASCPNPAKLYLGHNYAGNMRLYYKDPWDELDICAWEGPPEHEADPTIGRYLTRSAPVQARREHSQSTTSTQHIRGEFFYQATAGSSGIHRDLPADRGSHDSLSNLQGTKDIHPSQLEPLFWASRFKAHFEFNYVFEAQRCRRSLDWRLLYFRVAKAVQLFRTTNKTLYLESYTVATQRPIVSTLEWRSIIGEPLQDE